MLRLSGLDASLLYAETPTTHMHVMGTIVLEKADGIDFASVRDLLASRLHLIPPFRRRLVQTPLGIDHPMWMEDPDFDLDAHLQHLAVPEPGGIHELCDVVGRFASVQLDRDRPLWEMALVEGLADNRVALVTKLHHAIMDGGAGAEIMARIFDLSPEGGEVEGPTEEWVPELPPSPVRMAASEMAMRALRPGEMLSALRDARSGIVESVRENLAGRSRTAKLFSAPHTVLNGTLTASRAVGFGQVSLEDMKHVRAEFGVKLNDVILAASCAAIRRLLVAMQAMPSFPLVAAVPVSVRDESHEGTGNRVSVMNVRLPVQMDDDAAVLAYVAEESRNAKAVAGRIGSDMLQQATDVLPPGMVRGLGRLYERTRLADRLPPPYNVVVSNVAGPPFPLYCAGAPVEAIYPMGPLMHGSGLNLTAISNCGNVDVGVITCRDKAPQAQLVADEFRDAVARLVKAADEKRS